MSLGLFLKTVNRSQRPKECKALWRETSEDKEGTIHNVNHI